ncbi:transposase [SAR92 clade bacterium H455]|uniref:Transposase n=1 Tax=SAR92 clade bacterium H455 TaxID=2974818 RepID=A0ABY5TLU2_9GAMM|nr:transposase [SAR92 clade bacterium H455]
MGTKFTQSFKMQAVAKKVLRRKQGVNIEEVAINMGVGYSILQKWIRISKSQEFETSSPDDIDIMTKDKREKTARLEPGRTAKYGDYLWFVK